MQCGVDYEGMTEEFRVVLCASHAKYCVVIPLCSLWQELNNAVISRLDNQIFKKAVPSEIL